MSQIIKKNRLTWINFKNPKPKDFSFLKKEVGLNSCVLKELKLPSQRPRAEESESYLYLVVHIPLFDKKTRVTFPGELDIIITEKYLVTSHLGENIPIKAIFKEYQEDPATLEKAFSRSSGFLLFSVLKKLTLSCLPKIDHVNEQIGQLEKDIFEDNGKSMVREISIIKRDILAFRRTLKPQREILESLVKNRYRLLEASLNPHLHDLVGINIRVWNALENTKEVIRSLEESNNSLVSYQLNQAMRFLAAASLITFTLSVTAGIFSILPFSSFSSAHEPVTFWLILLFMTLISLSLILVFRKKRWL